MHVPPHTPIRVLVTGFHDWWDPARPWKCDLNPSGQLILGPGFHGDAPPVITDHRGPLPPACAARSARHDLPVEWSFKTLKVVWGTGAAIPWHDHDVVFSLGLGVYGGETHLQLEVLPRNLRQGNDVLGHPPPRPTIDHDESPDHRLAPPAPLVTILRGLTGPDIKLSAASDGEFYICNETTYRGLHALTHRPAAARLRAVTFVHIPTLQAVPLPTLAARVADLLINILLDCRAAGVLP